MAAIKVGNCITYEVKEEERIKLRITEIEYEVMRCHDLQKIWKLKKEHRYLSNMLKRIIRKAEN